MLPLTDQEQELREDDSKSKDCFAKQLEISSQFSYDFDKYNDSKGIISSNEQKSKTTKLVRLSEDEWKYLQNGRAIQAQIR